jgi:hypothetical protein
VPSSTSSSLNSRSRIWDPLKSFLDVHIQRSSTSFFLSHEQYAEDLLDRAGMADYKLALTVTTHVTETLIKVINK